MLIGMCGYAGHGKDSVAAILVERGFIRIGLADKVKEFAIAVDPYVQITKNEPFNHCDEYERLTEVIRDVGMEEAKKLPDVRRLLQRVGTEGGRAIIGEDVWIDLAFKDADRYMAEGKSVVISDCRFPFNEGKRVVDRGGKIWRVTRYNDGITFDNGIGTSHPSESQIHLFSPHIEIANDSNLEHLRQKVLIELNILEIETTHGAT